MSTRKRTKGGRFESSVKSSDIATNTTMKTKKVDTEKSHPVITEDHPVVQKILAYIEKEIKPEPKELVRQVELQNYLGCLPDEELVIYGLYKDLDLVPAIYEYHKTHELSESDANKLIRFL
jgi:hypothetical protein